MGAVRDHLAGRRPARTVRLDGRPVRGEERGVGRHRRETGQGRVQFHRQRVVVDRPHAQLRRRQAPGQDSPSRSHHPGELQVPAAGRRGRRVDRALPRIHEVVRGHRIAVRPSGVLAQGEGVGGVAVGGGVAGGRPGNEVALRVLARISHQIASEGTKMPEFTGRTRVRARRRTRQYVEHPGRVQCSKCSHIRVCSRDLGRVEDWRADL